VAVRSSRPPRSAASACSTIRPACLVGFKAVDSTVVLIGQPRPRRAEPVAREMFRGARTSPPAVDLEVERKHGEFVAR